MLSALLISWLLACAEPVPPPPGATLAPPPEPVVQPAAPATAPAVDPQLLDIAVGAALDDPAAQYSLAARFFSGEGVPRSASAAAHLWAQVAATGDAASQSNLGYLLLFGDEEVPADPETAVGLLQAAAGGGHAEACVHLSRAYTRGLGVTPDPVEGWAWAEAGARRTEGESGAIAEAVRSSATEAQAEAEAALDEAGQQRARILADERARN